MNSANSAAKQALIDQRGGSFSGHSSPCGPRKQQTQANTPHGDQSSARDGFRGQPINRGGAFPGKKSRNSNGWRKPYLEVLQPPRTHGNPFGFLNVQPDRPIPLAGDHPLKEELAEVKRERELRKLYWAGLAQRIPEEMENPGSYDYQRWKEEERLADAKVEKLAGLIALAERGIPVMREDPEPQVQDLRPSQSQTMTQGLQRTAKKRKRLRTKRGKDEQHPKQDNCNQNFAAEQGYRRRNRMRYRGARTPETVVWTDDAKSKAVAKWMRRMGVNLIEEERPEAPLFIGGDSKSITSFSDDNMDSDESAHPKDDDGVTVREGDVSDQIPKRPLWVEARSQAAWTAEEEAAFEEAETLREEERLALAMRMNTMINEPSSLSHVASVTEMIMTTEPRLYRDDKIVAEKVATVHAAAPPKMSQMAQATNITKQCTLKETPESLVEPTTASKPQPAVSTSTALPSISFVKDHAAEGRTLSKFEEEARKSSELLAALLEELNRSSASPSPEPEFEKLSVSAPNYPTSTAAPQSFLTISRKQEFNKDLNKPFQARNESLEIPTTSKKPLKIENAVFSNANTLPSMKLPSLHSEPSVPPTKTNSVSERQRAMAAAVLKRVQARKLELSISQRADMATEQQLAVPARVPSKTLTVLPSSDIPVALDTSQDNIRVEENNTQHRPKASDYMDIDKVDVVEIIDMQDVLESESEDGKAVGSITSPVEIGSLSCSGEEEDTNSDEDGGIKLGNDVVQQEKICGTQIERANPGNPASQLPLAGRVLYIGNLSFEATEEDLREVLDDYQIEAIIIPEDMVMQHRSPGYAFAVMSSPSEAESAIADSYDFHINQRMVTVRLGSLPKQFVSMCEAPRGSVENPGPGSQQNVRSLTTGMVQYSPPQVPSEYKESESQAPIPLLTLPWYGIKTAEEVQEMLDNPDVSLTTLTESQQRKHIAFLEDQLAIITEYKIHRQEGHELTVAEMKKINRETDLVHYLKELWRWNGG